MGLSGPFADAAEALELSDEPAVAPPASEPADTPSAPPIEPSPATEPTPGPADRMVDRALAAQAPPSTDWKTDAQGRLHRPDGTIASKAEADDYKAKHPEAVAPAATAPDTGPADAAPAPAEPAVMPTPYVFAGQDAPIIEGALIHPTSGDIFIPAAQRDLLERNFMRGQKYEQFRDERREALQRADAVEKRGAATVSALVEALPFLHTREAFLQFLDDAAQSPEKAELVFDRLNLAIERKLDEVARQFGPAAKGASEPSRASGDATPAPPLDRDDATEAFTDHVREMLARPEFRGMPADLQKQVRESLANAQLFVRDADGDWCLNENAAAPIWDMARKAMTSATAAVRAKDFNAGQATRAAATTAAPPSVAAGKPRAGAPAASGLGTAKDPMIDPKTGQPYDDPWDAIKRVRYE